uniref:Uncharacterized protein n=1 Tax=Arundo donax TaxID=35708 RepID=A0A0A9F921_ARUDO
MGQHRGKKLIKHEWTETKSSSHHEQGLQPDGRTDGLKKSWRAVR